MNAQDALKLARRFIELPQEKRRLFLEGLQQQGVDFALFPIPAEVLVDARDGLSYAQQRMWFLWQLDPQSAAYNLPMAVRLNGELDNAALQSAFDALVARHETLRSQFSEQDGVVRQRIVEPFAVSIARHDLSGLASAEREEQVRSLADAEALAPFDLAQGPLLRVQLLTLADQEHVLLLTLHHIVSDGWSYNVLIDEFIRLYDAASSGSDAALQPLPIQYRDYALWQRSWLEAGEQDRQLDYWRNKLGDDHSPLELPIDHARPVTPSYRGARHEFQVEAALAERLRGLAREQGVTLFMVLLAAFKVLLHRYSGQQAIRVGVPVANRNRAEVEGLIGCFINTQVLHTEIDPLNDVRELLQRVKETALGAQGHQELPFERLVEAFGLERSLSISPLFQVMFNHQSQVADAGAIKGQSGLSIAALERETRIAQFDLSLDTYEKGGKLFAAFGYATDLFDSRTVAQMAGHYSNLLLALATQPQARVCELVVLDDEQRRQIVQGWNTTQVDYPLQRGVHQLIEAQAEQIPQAPALTFGAQTLSYAELNARANRLAHHLIAQGVQPDGLVGIAAERSLEMVVGLLAVLKAGGAYVPLDPEYPTERLAYMLEDSGIRLLLSQSHLDLPLSEGVQRIDLDQQGDWLAGLPDTNPQVLLTGEHLAYVIYTSGSTGKPKGAGNRHSALTNRLCWMQQAYGLDDSDSVMQKTPFSFDVSVWEFFWPLMTGARLVVAQPGAHRDPAQLVELINRESITTLHFVPSMLQAFLQDTNVGSCSSLKRIVCSGEALPVDAQQQVFAKLPQAGLYNLYGPTEAAIDVTHWTCVNEGRDAVPIGLPIANLGCHVLDANLEPVPVGVLGELYLFGEGLARGYHQRPALTGERFVASPFADGARMYRTGDLARYRNDGVIEYAGRIDHQVKLRGLRIELGEIEARLLEHEAVRETAVLAVDGKHLVGYVVLAQQNDDWRESLAAYLAQSLPDYMVPAQWIDLAQMPLSPNGKLDRKALPRPDASTAQTEYAAPQNELEQRIAEIWQDVLKREHIGRNDNFFELGGDSIVSIQVVSRARQAGIQFSPKDLFLHQTVRSLATVAETGVAARLIDQGPAVGDVQLTPVQHWFFDLPMSERQHWNQSLLLDAQQPVVAERLEQALQAVVQHHDALRLRYASEGGSWRQWYADVGTEQNLLWHGPDSNAFYDEVQRSLNLAEGPLLRAALMERPEGGQRLLLAIHHLVVDGVSWRILLEDLQTTYQRLAVGQNPALPAKTSAYQSWAARLEASTTAEQRQQELDGWLTRLQGSVQGPMQELPRDNPDGGLLNKHGATLDIRLDAERTERLLKQAPAAYRTQVNDLLLTALARVLCRWSGNESVLVQMEGHGREDLFDDIDLTRTVGWFTSLYPVKLTPATELSASLKAVKEQLRGVPDKGLGYGLLRYLGTPETRQALAALPQPRVTFNYLGQFDSQFDEKALFTPAGKGGGQAQADDAPLANWLSVEGQVYGGELSLRWGYSAEMYRAETIQRLADELVAELHAVIEHCTDTQTFAVTPSDFPLAGLTQAQLDDLPIPARDIEDIYPLSPMQQGMLFHTLYEQEGGDYINQMRVDVEGLDVERFRQAWQDTLNAHDILRTALLLDDGEPLQIVQQQVELPFDVRDLCHEADQLVALDILAEQERLRGFDLSQAPLLRLTLVELGGGRHHLLYTSHHILMDGWSNGQVLGEVLQRYAGQQPPRAAGHYRDYIAWLQNQDAQACEVFWKGYLADLKEPTRLAQATRHTPEGDSQGQSDYTRVLEPKMTQRLGELARQHKVTVNTLVQAAWLLLLQRYTRQDSVAFGATVSGRPVALKGVEQQVGLFINTLPVIAQPLPEQSVGEWLQKVQALNLALRDYEHTPLYDIQNWAGQGGDSLFDSLLVFENYPVAEILQSKSPAGLRFGEVINREQTNYPLTLVVGLGDTLSVQFVYSQQSFDRSRIEQLAGHFENLLQAMAGSGDVLVGELQMLGSEEHQLIVQEWNDQRADYPVALGIHQLVEQQVEKTPDAVAVVFNDASLSYAELNTWANRLAHKLRERGVGPDVLVGLAVERSLEMVVGLLAILKAGGGYVPLDPDYPQDRLEYMIKDSNALLLISQSSLLNRLPEASRNEAVLLDTLLLDDYSSENISVLISSKNLAYTIYTSGSTGRPKGVLIEHRNAAALIGWARTVYPPDTLKGVLASTSICFDLSVWELFVTLSSGGYVVLAVNALELPQLSAKDQVRLINTVPSAIKALCESQQIPRTVRTINLAGEPLSQALVDELYQLEHLDAVYDLYGPSEDTTYSTYTLRTPGGRAHIGRPLANTCAYLIDDAMQPAPVGCLGELCLTGAGLSRGYLGQPALTAEKFLPDPFAQDGGRLYRTGDLARYSIDGTIEYAGRIDHQVKIRGFRIELGEIEAQLLAQQEVHEAAVLALDGAAGKQLAAYVVATESAADRASLHESLKSRLRTELPDYMVPSYFVFIDALPLTPNGKLDRKALPKPDVDLQRAHVEPQTLMQQRVAEIWADVLQLDHVGLSDNFFELGGHSLLATRVVSRIRQALHLELPLRVLFEASSLLDFVKHIESQGPGNTPPLVRVDRDQHLGLSYAQQRQWFLWQLESDNTAYNIPVALRFKGGLDRVALQYSVDCLIARHEALRTTFRQQGELAAQVIHTELPVVIGCESLEKEGDIPARVEAEIQQPFDLVNGPLLRVKLLRLTDADHVLVMTLHHIVSDGWSMPVMVEELVSLYEGYRQGQVVSLPALPIQYVDYAIWQRRWMEGGEQERQLAYWTEHLGGDQPVLELPLDRPRPSVQSYAGASLNLDLKGELASSLRQLARQQGVTLFMVLLASFQTLLHRYSGQADVRVGVPNANRNRVETERLIGFFVNTQVLKAEFDLHTTFSALLQQVKGVALGAQAHQDLPFEKLVEALQPERSLSHSPLFQVMFNHQTALKGPRHTLQQLSVESVAGNSHTAQFDLTLETFEAQERLGASLIYSTALFDASTIERLGRHWLQLLEQIVREPEQRIAELALLSVDERQQIVSDWNRTEVIYPTEQCIHQLIEQQVVKTPDALALTFGEESLSYAELNRRANRLAHLLHERGVGPDVLVGIALERSIEMVVGLLGILKAGGAYVPLDPEYPQDRLTYMMQDSGIGLLLTQSSLLKTLPVPEHVQVLSLDLAHEELSRYSGVNPGNEAQLSNLAYVIYTSGSTGKPKGAGNSHKALFNRLAWMQKAYDLDGSDTVLQKTPFSFDVSVWEFFWPLQTGARLAIAQPGEHRDPERLIETIQRYEVTTLHFVPSMLQVFMGSDGVESCQSIRRIVCSGEALPGELARKSLQRLPQAGVYNLYGPTEAAIDVTHWTCGPDEGASVPIGLPIDNLKTHILAPSLLPAAQGCVGELYLGGFGLARGYHQRPSLTAERFVPDAYDSSEQGGGRLYRTGDLAAYRDNGIIDYLGRTDHQVKIRGLRIELGEIEAKLQEHEALREAVVIDVEGPGGKQLAGYLVAAVPITEAQQQNELRVSLREHLKGHLPEYMVPAHLIFLDKLPLSPNGKLDRKALPKPDVSQQQQVYVAPQTELEQQLAEIWAQVLKVEQVGLSDNFFELGGHSLLATQVISRIRQTLNLELPLRTLFEAPVLADFSRHASVGVISTAPDFERVNRDQPLVLSYAQQRQWFLWQLEPQSAVYNMPTVLRLKGQLDIELLRASFQALIARHETLRTTFRQEGEQAVQIIHPWLELKLDQENLAGASNAAVQARIEVEVARPFDLKHGPLLRMCLLSQSETEHVLVLTLHHIVSDGWSMPVMVDELVQLYEGYRSGREAVLPALPIQYADYASWQRNWMDAGERERQLDYWKGHLGDEHPVLELPIDRPRPAVQSQAGAELQIKLGDDLVQSLKNLAQRQGVTLFTLLLASFQTLLHRYSGQAGIRVGVPIANRTRMETERLIGFFVNTQVLQAEFALNMTFSGLLKQLQQTVLDAYAHQDLPFEQLVEALQPGRSLSHSPLFQVMYNHQTQVRGERHTLPGLEVDVLAWEGDVSKFDLTLDTFEHEQGLGASLTYATALFDESTIDRLAGHWVNILEGVVKAPQQRIGELPMLSDTERFSILAQLDNMHTHYPSSRYVHQLIEDQARVAPDAVAVIFAEQHLTYCELDTRANRLAHKLIELGVGPEVRVAIAMRRSAETIVTFLAVMKAGGVYVPLDITYPESRLLYTMKDCAAALVLTHSEILEHLPIPEGLPTLSIDNLDQWSEYPQVAPSTALAEDNLAYVIYTSGSTGQPKGVAVAHGPLVSHVRATGERYEMTPADCELNFMSFAFDGAHEGWMHPLINGARILIREDELWLPERTYKEMHRHGVTVGGFPPVYLQQLAEFAEIDGNPPLVRVYCVGGDAVSQASYDLAWRALRPEYWLNGYGPTETVVTPLLWKAKKGDVCGAAYAPIGTLLGKRRGYVLDVDLNLLPVGLAGELFLGGEGVARGYLERPALTAERFVPDPFGNGERVYRSGDLTRARPDGVVDYLGRVDHQVKVRGFRIELGEIEAQLLEQPSVREAVVLARDGVGGKQLVGYVVPMEPAQEDLRDILRSALKAVLPDYMVPAHVLILDSLPLTPNGKLDRKALPQPDASLMQQAYVAPGTELEQQIAAIWADVLKLDRVGLNDNFFELGGHSLLATLVTSRVQSELGGNVPLDLLFKADALKDYAASTVPYLSLGSESDLNELHDFLSELETI